MLTDTQKTEVKEISKALKALDCEGVQLVSAVVACLLARQCMDRETQQKQPA